MRHYFSSFKVSEPITQEKYNSIFPVTFYRFFLFFSCAIDGFFLFDFEFDWLI